MYTLSKKSTDMALSKQWKSSTLSLEPLYIGSHVLTFICNSKGDYSQTKLYSYFSISGYIKFRRC